jgi:predicted TIM-barrel fold metal-dependent hydrolase
VEIKKENNMFIDIHAHAYRRSGYPQDGYTYFATPEQLLPRYDELQIEKACLLPLIGPEVYLPQSTDDILEMAAAHPDRFIPFCNVDPRALTNTPHTNFGDLLRYWKDCGCKGIGEVMPNLPFLDPLVQNLFKHVQDAGLPLIFDITHRIGWGYGLVDSVGLPQLEQTLRNFPKLNILCHGPSFWSQIGELKTPADMATYPNYPVEKEGVVPTLLRRYENCWGDLSAGSGYNALARDPGYAVQFLNEFQDKLLFGTDICSAKQEAPLAGFLLELRKDNKISETVFQKIARENAIRLLKL